MIHTSILSVLGALVVTLTATTHRPSANAAPPPSHSARVAAFAWPGVFDIVGSGFPDGERRAVMHIARTDTTYTLVSLQGPPGTLMRFHVTGDSATVIWNLGTEVMMVDLRGTGDSLTGQWTSGDWSGQVQGTRRR